MNIFMSLYYYRCATSVRTAASVKANNKRVLLSIVGTLEKGNETNTRSYHEVTGDIITPSQVMGIDHLRDPRLNKVCKLKQTLFSFLYLVMYDL